VTTRSFDDSVWSLSVLLDDVDSEGLFVSGYLDDAAPLWPWSCSSGRARGTLIVCDDDNEDEVACLSRRTPSRCGTENGRLLAELEHSMIFVARGLLCSPGGAVGKPIPETKDIL
jgi:hypothetical protein